jgi:hypothetical protein
VKSFGCATGAKLKSINISVNFNREDVGAVLKFFPEKSREMDPDNEGVHFVLGDLTHLPPGTVR